jgi:hypothetical protein
MGDRPSRQGLNDVRVLGEGMNGMRIKPPSHLLGSAWNDTPTHCARCGIRLSGAYFDHPKGYFCSMECAGDAVKRPITYREAVNNDPFLALREAMRTIR